MNLAVKNFIILSLILLFAGIFTFHWFFIDKSMPISECLSTNCVYSSPQVIPPESQGVLLISLVLAFLAVVLPLFFGVDNKFENTSQSFSVFEKGISVFDFKLKSWLKILEKRDPQNVLITARI